MKKRIILFTLFLCAVLPLSICGAAYFTDKGSIQAGGCIHYNHSKETVTISGRTFEYSKDIFIINPIINFFPMRNFLFGPSFTFIIEDEGPNTEADAYTAFGLNFGVAYGRSPVIPFIAGSPQIVFTDKGPMTNEAEFGFCMEFNGGVMIPVQKRFTVNMGPALRFEVQDRYSRFDFFFMTGITGWVL